jgi:hypothetical protein
MIPFPIRYTYCRPGLALGAFLLALVPCFAAGALGGLPQPIDCDYYMCQYEKGNIDTVILEHAKLSQTVMFGEIHDTVLTGAPAPVGDSLYVVSLLPELMAIGYRYLALEVDKTAQTEGHSRDLVRFHAACRQGRCGGTKRYPHAKPGWIGLVGRAIELGYEIRFIDVPPGAGFRHRDREMYENLKREIFDRDEAARVIVYIGANHIGEQPTHTGIYLYKGKRRPLGYYLDAFTRGRNFSVYMGHPWDTPEGCDLFIGDFIWNLYEEVDKR